MTVQSALFTPFDSPHLQLPNRVVMSAMTRRLSPGGVTTDDMAKYYRRRAENGVGLIITEGIGLDFQGSVLDIGEPYIYTHKSLSAWSDTVSQVHDEGGKIAAQLWHVGADPEAWMFDDDKYRGSFPATSQPLSPSGLVPDGRKISTALTLRQIDGLIGAYVDGAKNAKAVGFDAIEVHAGHGYLLDEFLWDKTNLRTDKYGGDLANRVTIVTEIVSAIRAAVGPDYPIFIRLSQFKITDYRAVLFATPGDLETVVRPLTEAGVDVFDMSQRRFWEPAFDGSPLNMAGWAKKLSGRSSMTVGSVGVSGTDFFQSIQEGDFNADVDRDHTIQGVDERLNAGEFDLVGSGRALLADPEWVAKLRRGDLDRITKYDQDMYEHGILT